MGLFGMSQYIGQVGGNIFVNFTVSGAIQIPGNFVAWWAMNRLGRKITLICSNTITGVAALLLIVISNGKDQSPRLCHAGVNHRCNRASCADYHLSFSQISRGFG